MGSKEQAPVWTDRLTEEEATATLEAASQLATVEWAKPLLATTKGRLDRLRVGLSNREVYSHNPLLASDLPFLFEIRFARALAEANVTAEYEHKAGIGNSSIDFRVSTDPPYLVELVSLRESIAVKRATRICEDYQKLKLETGAIDPITGDPAPDQTEEVEIIKAQTRILEKVFHSNRENTKFPLPYGAIHMILVDARGFMGVGLGDATDWDIMLFGRKIGNENYVRYQLNYSDKKLHRIRGIFEPGCPLRGVSALQERIHFLGFVCEKGFHPDELRRQVIYYANPHLFEDHASAIEILKYWPLYSGHI